MLSLKSFGFIALSLALTAFPTQKSQAGVGIAVGALAGGGTGQKIIGVALGGGVITWGVSLFKGIVAGQMHTYALPVGLIVLSANTETDNYTTALRNTYVDIDDLSFLDEIALATQTAVNQALSLNPNAKETTVPETLIRRAALGKSVTEEQVNRVVRDLSN